MILDAMLCENMQVDLMAALAFGQKQVAVTKNVLNTRNCSKEILLEILRTPEKKVELVTLFNSIDIQKEYDGFTLVFNGKRFRKLVPGVEGTQLLTRKELSRFIVDILEAVKSDWKIREFIEKNRLPITSTK